MNIFTNNYMSDDFESTFVGRESELQTLFIEITKSNLPIIITGKRGIGKTALLEMFRRRFSQKLQLDLHNIFNVSGHNYQEIDKIYEDYLNKKNGKALIFVDNAEILPENKFIDYVESSLKSPNIRIILSTNKLYPQISNKCFILKLNSPSLKDVLKKRLEYFKGDIESKTKVNSFIAEFIDKFNDRNKTPRELLIEVNEFIHSHPESQTYLSGANVKYDSKNLVFEINIDYVGIIIGILLFIYSQITSNMSETKIVKEINQTKHTIENLISDLHRQDNENNNKYYANRNVNLRNKPTSQNSKVLEVIPINKVVYFVKSSVDWHYVYYDNFIDNNRIYGWIYSKYLTKIK